MRPVQVAFVWHMHQPWYLWPEGMEAALPFVRLHAYAGYTDMPWLVRRFDDTRVTFNLVPSLMAQIVGYARGEITDQPLELCRRPAVDLTEDEHRFAVKAPLRESQDLGSKKHSGEHEQHGRRHHRALYPAGQEAENEDHQQKEDELSHDQHLACS